MDIDIQIAESLIEAFNHEETGILLYDKNDKLIFRNKDMQNRFIKLDIPYIVGESFYERLNKIKKKKLLPEKLIDERINSFKKAKNSKKPQEYLVKGPTGRWIQIKDTLTPSGNVLTLMTNVTKIVEQEEERKRLVNAIDHFPGPVLFWDENDKLIIANEKANKLNEQFGVKLKLKKGTRYEDMLRAQIEKNFYITNDKETGIAPKKRGKEFEEYFQKRIRFRKKLKTGIREITLKDKSTILANEVRLSDGSLLSIYSDVSELKNQQMLNQKLTNAIDYMPNSIMLWDKDNKLVMGNRRVKSEQKKLGFNMERGASRLEMVKNNLEKGFILPPKNMSKKQFLESRKNEFTKLKGESILESELGNGNYHLVSTARLPDGGTLQFISDITDIKKRETELKRLVDAVDNMPTQVILWDKDNKLLMANKQVKLKEKTLGLKFKPGINRLEIVKHSLSKGFLTPPSNMTKNQFLKERKKEWSNQKKLKEQRVLDNVYGDGSIFLVDTSILPDGASLQFFTDITKIKKNELSLKRLRDAIENVPSGIHFWDENDELILANKKAKDLHKSWKFPFKLETGVKYKDLYKSLMSHKVFTPPKGMTIDAAVKERIKNRNKIKSGSREVELENGNTFFASEIKLDDGSVLSIFSDISEIKKRETEYKIVSDALNTLPHGATLWDKEDRLIMANNFAYEIWEAGGILLKPGDTYADYLALQVKHNFVNFGDMDKKEQKEYFQKVLKSRKEFKDEMTFITPPFYNGSIWQSTSTRLSNGGIFSLLTNITEIKKKEKELQQLVDAIDQIPNIFMLWDKNNKLIHFNRVAKEVSKKIHDFEMKNGISRKQFVSAMIDSGTINVPDGITKRDFIDEREKRIQNIKDKERFETPLTNGITYAGFVTKLSDGSYTQVMDDITDLKIKEKQARDAEKRLQDAIDSMPHGISLWDKNDVLVMNNKYAYDIHKKAGIDNYVPGITFEEQTLAHKEKNFLKFDNEEDKRKYFESAFKNRKAFSGTKTIEVPQFYDDSYWSATYTRLEDNSVFTIFSNITELKKRENQLKKTISQLDDEKEKANAANKTKSQFLANMSHELRTPLNAIIGLTEMLKEDATDDGLDDFVEPLDRVFNAGKHLLTLINDVLDLSKIEAGKIDLFNETFELKPIMDDIIKTSETLAAKNENKLLLNFDDKIDQITSDQTRIKQVVLNLISNACKFTEKGTITVSLKKKNRTFIRNGRKMSLGDMIIVEISDTGIGMSQDQMDRLFNSFVQADSSTTRKYGGTGLGLTISKQLAIMMGGDVKVKSILNEGTTFIFTFLADYKDASKDTKNKKTQQSSLIKNVVSLENQNTIENKNAKTILVIDDDPTVSELIKRQLTKNASYNVIIADNGKDGLKLAKEIRPNLITLDILMPEMDGWSVLRTLKADPEVSSIPVIMASILDEKNKGFSLGASDFISKPIDKESLLNSIETLIGKSENLKICIIEDDENLRFTIKELLQKQGNIVFEAKNGKVGIDLLEKEESMPDLILLDLMMPEMNGFEFLNKIKGTKFKSIPVLVLTGADLQDEDIKFLKGETEKIIQKTDDTVLSIAEEINKVMKETG